MNPQNNSNKKITPDNPPPTGEDPKKKNRINIYWIYGILFVGIVAYNMYRGVGTEGILTDKLKFYEMVKQGMAFIAKEQTAGKGQRGKNWQMEAGKNIALTLVLKTDTLRAADQFYLSMLIALGASDFLKNNAVAPITIKWPNDLYWRDRKAGGILIETVMQGNAWKWAVVGIGININQTHFDSSLPNPVSLKNITGKDYDVIELGKMLYECVMKRVEGRAISPGKVLEEYNRNLYKIGATVKLKKGNAVFQTSIKAVTMLGQLQTVDSMERQFDFGEVEWVI